jgi:hypothetical protein
MTPFLLGKSRGECCGKQETRRIGAGPPAFATRLLFDIDDVKER